ncbi:hypothetical protein ACOSQ4_024781 [Xanthoceras sorbifolium]
MRSTLGGKKDDGRVSRLGTFQFDVDQKTHPRGSQYFSASVTLDRDKLPRICAQKQRLVSRIKKKIPKKQ